MSQYVLKIPGVEIIGYAIMSFVDGMSTYAPMAYKILAKHGIKNVEVEGFYSAQAWLNAFRDVAEGMGEHTLFAIGKKIFDNAPWPPFEALEDGLASIDIAYHMNHRLNGQRMWNQETKVMVAGIGHYSKPRMEGKRRAVMVCDNPYPSDFDRGILTAVARRIKPTAEVTLDEAQPTRRKGGESCTFIITW